MQSERSLSSAIGVFVIATLVSASAISLGVFLLASALNLAARKSELEHDPARMVALLALGEADQAHVLSEWLLQGADR
ncbi:MAG: hypothetical protein JWN48_3456 [Myxococcaceae bacterium]|nr:hypothetical protein [Myxococcaceae bacterium]